MNYNTNSPPRPTVAELVDLPVVVDLLTAARILRIGRTTAYTLARTGQFPCPVIRIGTTYRVPTAGLLALLGLPGLAAGMRSESVKRTEHSGSGFPER